jgi:hypothetical protein
VQCFAATDSCEPQFENSVKEEQRERTLAPVERIFMTDALLFAGYPEPIPPFVPCEGQCISIPLFQDAVNLDFAKETFRTDASIALRWQPFPQIQFEIPELPEGVFLNPRSTFSIRFDDGAVIKGPRVVGVSMSSGPEDLKSSAYGRIRERFLRPKDSPAQYALFLLPNFEMVQGSGLRYPDGSARGARLLLADGVWAITLDQTEAAAAAEKALKENSGFAITHVGRLERADGQPVTASQMRLMLNAFACYVSFCCGRWTGPCLPKGFDQCGAQVWETWDYSRTVPYASLRSWMDPSERDHFEGPFPGFIKLFLDEAWGEALQIAIHWYLEANAQAGSIEGAIVLTQTAFELLSSVVLVEDQCTLSAEAYEKLTAADRIRLLFRWAGIPTSIPMELNDLTQLAAADNWPDSPTAMTRIRNTITHPTKKNREKYAKHSHGARTDSWRLGLWCLELCLLRLFEYRGTYANRITQRFSGEVVSVPWATDEVEAG